MESNVETPGEETRWVGIKAKEFILAVLVLDFESLDRNKYFKKRYLEEKKLFLIDFLIPVFS